MHYNLSDQDIAILITALRVWQERAMPLTSKDLLNIATNGGQYPAPTSDELDALCERLNFSGALYLKLLEKET